MRKIIGIDPGLVNTGWGIIAVDSNRLSYVASGTIKTISTDRIENRLSKIYTAIVAALVMHQPQEVAIEDVYVNKNPMSSLKLGQARAASILAASSAGLKIFEYAPRLIKKAVTSTGRADKQQVAAMIRYLLPQSKPANEHENDALAVAMTHINLTSVYSKLTT